MLASGGKGTLHRGEKFPCERQQISASSLQLLDQLGLTAYAFLAFADMTLGHLQETVA
jgi:hypothetical protein